MREYYAYRPSSYIIIEDGDIYIEGGGSDKNQVNSIIIEKEFNIRTEGEEMVSRIKSIEQYIRENMLNYNSDIKDYNSLLERNIIFFINERKGLLIKYSKISKNIDTQREGKVNHPLNNKTDLNEKERAMSISSSMYEFDFALSFAGEDRTIVDSIANKLIEKKIKVFYDNFFKADLLGKDLSEHFKKTYGGNKSRFVVIFISKNYILKDWTNFEFEIAKEEEKTRKVEYILPVRLDNTIFQGMSRNKAYINYNKEGLEGTVNILSEKLKLGKEENKLSIEKEKPKTLKIKDLKNLLYKELYETYRQSPDSMPGGRYYLTYLSEKYKNDFIIQENDFIIAMDSLESEHCVKLTKTMDSYLPLFFKIQPRIIDYIEND